MYGTKSVVEKVTKKDITVIPVKREYSDVKTYYYAGKAGNHSSVQDFSSEKRDAVRKVHHSRSHKWSRLNFVLVLAVMTQTSAMKRESSEGHTPDKIGQRPLDNPNKLRVTNPNKLHEAGAVSEQFVAMEDHPTKFVKDLDELRQKSRELTPMEKNALIAELVRMHENGVPGCPNPDGMAFTPNSAKITVQAQKSLKQHPDVRKCGIRSRDPETTARYSQWKTFNKSHFKGHSKDHLYCDNWPTFFAWDDELKLLKGRNPSYCAAERFRAKENPFPYRIKGMTHYCVWDFYGNTDRLITDGIVDLIRKGTIKGLPSLDNLVVCWENPAELKSQPLVMHHHFLFRND